MSTQEKLQQPFKPDELEWRVGPTTQDKTKGIALAYVTNRAIQNRLDDVFGVFGWQNAYLAWKGTSQLCGISAKCAEEWITKWDGADDSDMEAVKGGLSDSMKRAAVQWGIGRYLYNLPNVWCPIEPAGKSYKLTAPPALPAWALPEGYEPPTKQAQNVQPVQPVQPEADEPRTDLQMQTILKLQGIIGYSDADRDKEIKKLVAGWDGGKLTKAQAKRVIEALQEIRKKQEAGK